jgi:hypothetical protein
LFVMVNEYCVIIPISRFWDASVAQQVIVASTSATDSGNPYLTLIRLNDDTTLVGITRLRRVQ